MIAVVPSYVPGAPGLVSEIVFRSGGAPMMKTVKTYDNLNRLTKSESASGVRLVTSHTCAYNSANQRTQRQDADGSRWEYGYDSLGQVTSATRRWADGALVTGQQYSYQFDDIGNRRSAEVSGQRSEYTANLLNQYTQRRTVPGQLWITGEAAAEAFVTVNGQSTERQND